MPPASPETTLVWRMASSSDVLPWSTWPMMVTTGARGCWSSSSSVWPMKPSSTSASDTRLGVWPNSRTISSAVSASITSLILCIAPCLIRSLMTSTERSVMRLASSWMVITSGMMTSRMTLSRGCTTPAWRSFSRSRRRFSEASERSRCASSKALLMVSLMRSRFSSPILTGRLGRLGALLLVARVLLDLGLELEGAAAALGDLLFAALGRLGDLGLLVGARLGVGSRLVSDGRLGLRDRLGDRRLRHGGGRGLDLDGLRLGLGPQCLQADALALPRPRRVRAPAPARGGAHRARRRTGRPAAA